jgi:pimeloyl-ACP methyl ester carboxylesterase
MNRWSILLRTVAVLSILLGLAQVSKARESVRPFYEATKQELDGPPGTLIRVEPWDMHTAYWVKAYRILYRSRGLKGEPIAVSGVVIIPQFPVPPGGRPIIAWAHPTTGIAVKCAPSLRDDLVDVIPGLTQIVPKGYVIVATDYPGLGTEGPHPYLVGLSEGRAVLDSVRAARSIPETQARNEFAIWGHSQGGHAALWAGELARSYAPELGLVGIAAAAPATELAPLFDRDERETAGKILGSMALVAWSKVFDLSLGSVLRPGAIPAADRISRDCINTLGGDIGVEMAEEPLQTQFLDADPTETEPWKSLIAGNTPGGSPISVPVFIAQGTEDKIVRPKLTRDFIRRLCDARQKVTFMELPGIDHAMAAWKSAPDAVSWIEERFRGIPVRSTCQQ